MNRRAALTWLLAVVAVLALFVAACGSDDDELGGQDDDHEHHRLEHGRRVRRPGQAERQARRPGLQLPGHLRAEDASDFDAAVQGRRRSATVTYTKTGRRTARRPSPTRRSTSPAPTRPSSPRRRRRSAAARSSTSRSSAAPITVAYNLSGVDELNLSADTLAKIFQARSPPGTTRPSRPTTPAPPCRRPRSPSSTARTARARRATSPSSSKAAAPDLWKLDAGDTVNWPAIDPGRREEHAASPRSSSRPTGPSATSTWPTRPRQNLNVRRRSRTPTASSSKPTPDSASAALAGAEVDARPHLQPAQRQGRRRLPDHVADVDPGRRQADRRRPRPTSSRRTSTTSSTNGQAQAKSLSATPRCPTR